MNPTSHTTNRRLTLVIVCVLAAAPLSSWLSAGSMRIQAGGSRVSVSVIDRLSLARQGVIVQSTEASCGAAALANFLRLVRPILVTEADVLSHIHILPGGTSFLELKNEAIRRGIKVRVLQMNFSDLQPYLPAIVHVHTKQNNRHFTVVIAQDILSLRVRDSARGNFRMSVSEFRKIWTGYVLTTK
jgi:predicted double-glycine peptidase